MPEIDPADPAAVPRRLLAESFADDEPDLPRRPAPAKPAREGLPPGYKMRADAHYVDQLTSRGSAPSSAEPAVTAPTLEGQKDRLQQLFAQLTESLASIGSASELLAGQQSAMARRVNLDLIRAHAARAAWLLSVNAIMQNQHGHRAKPRPLGFLLGQIRSALAAECRLTRAELHVHASDWNAVVPVDEASVVAGVIGAVHATFGLADHGDGLTVKITALTSGGQLRSIDVTQDNVAVTDAASRGFDDGSWKGEPGAWDDGVGVAAAKAVAHQHGGDALFLLSERGGSTIRLTFSRAN